MKECELCELPARMHCESDQAHLCWDCDAKVHSANFLVARHVRSLLCHACQIQTPWQASGSKLGRTITVCESCVAGSLGRRMPNVEDEGKEELEVNSEERKEEEGENGSDDCVDESGDEEEDEEDEDDEEEEDGDNQVVPWTSTTVSSMSGPSVSRSSEESSREICSSASTKSVTTTPISLKRSRENEDLECEDRRKHPFLASTGAEDEATSSSAPSQAPAKNQNILRSPESKTCMKRPQNREKSYKGTESSTITDISKQSKDQGR